MVLTDAAACCLFTVFLFTAVRVLPCLYLMLALNELLTVRVTVRWCCGRALSPRLVARHYVIPSGWRWCSVQLCPPSPDSRTLGFSSWL